MKKNKQVFLIENSGLCKAQILHWSNQFDVCTFLDNHAYDSPYAALDCIAAVKPRSSISLDSTDGQTLNHFIETHKGDWIFAHFNYEYHQITPTSNKINYTGFPLGYLYVPEIIIQISKNELTIESDALSASSIFDQIKNTLVPETMATTAQHEPVIISPVISKEVYIQSVQQILKQIARGDFYEINFCQAFKIAQISANPVDMYQRLTSLSPTPFACFYKNGAAYLMCASPERFLQKKDSQLLSQPIKGTIKRNLEDQASDLLQMKALENSSKDKSENVMVVDLVRNDLSKICEQGSVHVAELFGIYTYPQVHQMISTIKGTLKKNISFAQILEATFPMGSMTGAPKKKVMETIEKMEPTSRGLYAGTVGYFNPTGNFDFNVVIRSIFYNSLTEHANYQVGGGITIYSDPEKEYEECLLKAEAIKKVLTIID